MSEPLDVVMHAALEVARPVCLSLRRRGWDARLMVTAPSIGHRVVAIEIHLEHRVPIEAASTEGASAPVSLQATGEPMCPLSPSTPAKS